MNKGRYVFSQVLDFLPRFQFVRLVKKYRGDWHSKDLNCYNQLLHLLFGQLTGCDSVRDICLCLGAHENTSIILDFAIQSISPHSLALMKNETAVFTKN